MSRNADAITALQAVHRNVRVIVLYLVRDFRDAPEDSPIDLSAKRVESFTDLQSINCPFANTNEMNAGASLHFGEHPGFDELLVLVSWGGTQERLLEQKSIPA